MKMLGQRVKWCLVSRKVTLIEQWKLVSKGVTIFRKGLPRIFLPIKKYACFRSTCSIYRSDVEVLKSGERSWSPRLWHYSLGVVDGLLDERKRPKRKRKWRRWNNEKVLCRWVRGFPLPPLILLLARVLYFLVPPPHLLDLFPRSLPVAVLQLLTPCQCSLAFWTLGEDSKWNKIDSYSFSLAPSCHPRPYQGGETHHTHSSFPLH